MTRPGSTVLYGIQNGAPGGTGYPLDGTMKGWLGASFNASSTNLCLTAKPPMTGSPASATLPRSARMPRAWNIRHSTNGA